MKLVFFGTPEFAIPSLYALHKSSHKILAVVTAPDKQSGRGLKLMPSSIKLQAQELNYPIYQPHDLKEPNFSIALKEINADIYILVAYRILPAVILNIPKNGAVNLHASLLPKYRGASPIHHAILNGENMTGVTTFQVKKKVDTGKILLQNIYLMDENITCGEAYDDLATMGAELLIDTLDGIYHNNIKAKLQDHSLATLAPKISSEDYIIHWKNPAVKIHNQIRAFSPKPGAYTYIMNKRVKLFNSRIELHGKSKPLKPGQINYCNHILRVGTGSNNIIIHDIQIEGKTRLPIKKFLLGFPQIIGEYFG